MHVGMDDFASKLTGKVESITLPQPGQWIRQGQKMCTVRRDGCAVDMTPPSVTTSGTFESTREVSNGMGSVSIVGSYPNCSKGTLESRSTEVPPTSFKP